MILQSNPKAGYLAHKAEIDIAIARVLESGWYILGKEVDSFEREFADYIGVVYGVGVASGTDALELALRACGVEPGDFVVTVSHTAVATATAIARIGAKPLFVDIDPDRFTMDPGQLEAVLTSWKGPRPKAVVPVHLYGQPADMAKIMAITRKHGLRVVEDCAQAHGARIGEQRVGTWGDVGIFSFYPTKNLGAFGDAGMAVTDDPQLAEQIRLLREYGWRIRYVSDHVGANSRLDALQAAILRVRLRFLDADNARRRVIADTYTHLLQEPHLIFPREADGTTHVYHQYVIRMRNRDVLQSRLKDRGIGTLVHYPVPVHRQKPYGDSELRPLALRHTEKAAGEILSLPLFPQLTKEEVEKVADVILDTL